MKRPMKPEFSARGSRCPICKRNFRDPEACPHSIGQAVRRIDDDHLHAVVRYEITKAAAAAALSDEGDTSG